MSERSDLKKITRKYNVEFVEMPLPTQEELEARMAERLIVIMEDRYRDVPRLHRERMKRFSTFVRALAESEEEHLLLAMLLDEMYHSKYHQPAPSDNPPAEQPQRVRESSPQPKRSQELRSSQSRSSESRPSTERAADVREDEARGDDPRVAEPRGTERAAEGAVEEGERKKKKRRRKRRRKGGESGQPGSDATVADEPLDMQVVDDESDEESMDDAADVVDVAPPTAEPVGEPEAGAPLPHAEPRAMRAESRTDTSERAAPERTPRASRSKKTGESGGGGRDTSRSKSGSRRGASERLALDEPLLFDSIEVIEPDAPSTPAPEESAAAPAAKPRSRRKPTDEAAAPDDTSTSAATPRRRGPKRD